MSNHVQIEGLQESLRAFDQAPDNLLKVSKACLRQSVKPILRRLRANVPNVKWRKLIKSKMLRDRYKGNTSILIGYYQIGQKTGKSDREDWFKAYWSNYGTLTHRDPAHQFKEAIKKKTERRRNDVGQRAEHFFENAIAGSDEIFLEEFQTAIKARENEILKAK